MKFSEWLTKVDKLHQRTKDIALADVSESISCDGNTITITIGKSCSAELNGVQTGVRYLRHLYTNNKEEFDDMLESLEKSTDELVASVNEILLAITDEAVPSTVIARMKGEQVDGDAPGMLETMVKKKLDVLHKKLEKIGSSFKEFEISFPVAGKDLELSRSRRSQQLVRWGNLSQYEYGSNVGSLQENLQFLGAYDAILAKIERFAILMDLFKALQK